jgi:hypothetical protein
MKEEICEKKNFSPAIETLDHLLWEALLQDILKERPNELALSQAYSCKDNAVRVVYKICLATTTGIASSLYYDPILRFKNIKSLVGDMIDDGLLIKKVRPHNISYGEAKAICSHLSYRKFLFDTRTREEQLAILFYDNPDDLDLYEVAFVVIGHGVLSHQIVCPCSGEHLQNTVELIPFNFTLCEPKKIGIDTYEFRFELSDKF